MIVTILFLVLGVGWLPRMKTGKEGGLLHTAAVVPTVFFFFHGRHGGHRGKT